MASGQRSAPLPSQTRLDLRDILRRAPRIGGATFDGERASVIIADETVRWELHLPAIIRGRFVASIPQLVELEVEAPIQPEEVVD